MLIGPERLKAYSAPIAALPKRVLASTSAVPAEDSAARCDKPRTVCVGVQVPKPLPPAPAADGTGRMSRRERFSRRRRSGFLDDLLHKPADDLLYTPDQATRPIVPPVGSLVAGQRAAPLTLQPAGPIASSGVSRTGAGSARRISSLPDTDSFLDQVFCKNGFHGTV